MVADSSEDGSCPAPSVAEELSVDATSDRDATSAEISAIGCAENIRSSLKMRGLSDDIIAVIGRSWRDGTNVQYRTYIQAWNQFCSEEQINEIFPSLSDVLRFLHHIFSYGVKGQAVGYSCVNTARSALSTFIYVDNVPVGQHQIVRRYLKGVFNMKPALPRYECTGTWDLNVMLSYLYTLAPVSELSLKLLTYKLTMLLCIFTGQRSQAIHLFNVENMQLSFNRAEFVVTDLLKTSSPNSHKGVFEYKGFPPNRRLCIVTVLKEYLQRTLDIRGKTKQLLLTRKKPHGAASSDTVKRWVRECLELSGVDTSIFKAHSTRSASTSFGAKHNLSLDLIMKTAGWQNECTFTKFYKFEVKQNFGHEVLKAYMNSL